MTPRRRLAACVVLAAIAAALFAPAASSLAGPAERGSGAETSLKKGSKKGREEKPNPTPLWSLYPLKQGQPGEGEEEPQADTDALSTPPVKPTEQGPPESGAETGRTAVGQEGAGGISSSALVAAVAALTLAVLAVAIARKRARRRPQPSPPRIIPATPSSKSRVARATPSPLRAPDPAGTTASSNGSADAERKRARPRGAAGSLEGGAEGAPAESLAEASGVSGPGPTPRASEPASSEEPSEQGAAPPRHGPAEERVEPTPAEPPPHRAAPEPSEEPPGRGMARAPVTPVESADSASPGTEHESRTHEPEPVVDRQHVRVHLFDGRVIEGYKRGQYSQENRVLVLDVETVFDANGREVPRTPLDSFLLPPQIDRIEPFDEASDAPGAGAREVRRGGKLPAS